MKKIMTLAAIFAAVAMTFSACNKEQKPDNGGNNTENNGGEENQEPEYVNPIAIDGNFEDWDALTNAVSATCAADHSKPALKTLKAYADEYFLNVYVEWDEENVPTYAEDGGNPLMLCFCGNPDNGGYDAFSDLCVEYMCFAQPVDATGAFINWTDAVYAWVGDLHAAGWAWDVALEDLQATGMGSGNKYEIAIMMDVLKSIMDLDGKILLGAMQQVAWNSQGVLPNAEVSEENPTGTAPMLEVPIN